MSAYTNIRDIATSKVPIIGNLISTHFENSKQIKNVKAPAIFIHGLADPLIPYTHSEYLHANCASESKKIILPDHMTHNDFDFHDDIIKPVLDFLEQLGYDPNPTPSKPTITFREELFVPPSNF